MANNGNSRDKFEMPTENPYTVLSVEAAATKQAIDKAYKKLALKYHPDKNRANPEKAAIQFNRVKQAHAFLTDPKNRQQYDAAVAKKRRRSEQEQKRLAEMDTKRRKMKEELAAREAAVNTSATTTTTSSASSTHVDPNGELMKRLRRENIATMERMEMEAEECVPSTSAAATASSSASSSTTTTTTANQSTTSTSDMFPPDKSVKLKWRRAATDSQRKDKKFVRNAMNEFGTICSVSMLTKHAVVVFETAEHANAALSGPRSEFYRVGRIRGANGESTSTASTASKSTTNTNADNLAAFENDVLARMAAAAAKQKAAAT